VHARFLRPGYVPQIDWDLDLSAPEDGYLIIGCEWLAEDALQLMGVEYRTIPSGLYVLNPDLSYVSLACPNSQYEFD